MLAVSIILGMSEWIFLCDVFIFWVLNWLKIGQIGQKPNFFVFLCFELQTIATIWIIASLLLMSSAKKDVLENGCL